MTRRASVYNPRSVPSHDLVGQPAAFPVDATVRPCGVIPAGDERGRGPITGLVQHTMSLDDVVALRAA